MTVKYLRSCGLMVAALVAGCAPINQPLYHWGDYQQTIYQYHQDGVTDYAAQVGRIEALLNQAQAQGKSVPPGLHAHLGMLYFNTGREIEAREQFAMEKSLFPESGHFVDYVLKAQPEHNQ